MKKLTLTIGIEKSDKFVFKNKGLIKTKCPNCECLIDIKLNGLKADNSLSPLVEWHYIEEVIK